MTIPVMKPRLPSADHVEPYLRAIDETRIYGNFGPLVRSLESRYAEFLGVSETQVVSVSSATQGLTGAVQISPAVTWRIPAWTFPATGLAVLAAGKTLVLVDVLEASWRMDLNPAPDGVEESVGVLPVVPFGGAVQFAELATAGEFVIDAAASLGTRPMLAGLPSTGAVVFSMHATKVLGGGEGGLVVFGCSQRAEEFRSWANFGFSRSRVSRVAGTNAKMSEVTAAYCLAALDSWNDERRDWIRVRDEAYRISRTLQLDTGPTRQHDISPYWLFDTGSASRLVAIASGLALDGIQTRVWWPDTLDRMGAFRSPRVRVSSDLTTARSLSSRVLGLPLYRDMPDENFERIEASLQMIEGLR